VNRSATKSSGRPGARTGGKGARSQEARAEQAREKAEKLSKAGKGPKKGPAKPRAAPPPWAPPPGRGGAGRGGPSRGPRPDRGPSDRGPPARTERSVERARPDRAERAPRAAPDRAAPPRAKISGRALEAERCVIGRHAVEATLSHQSGRAEKLYAQEGGVGLEDIVELARELGVVVVKADATTLDNLAGTNMSHQGVVLACKPYPYVDIEDALAENPSLIVVLDGVEDPRNLGAASRAAFALGADLVVVPRDRAASATASAHKASAGALARIPVAQVGNLKRALEMMKERGIWIVGAEADAPAAPWGVDMREPTALVIGGEDRGLRRLTREACDHVVSIPMADEGMSLNAADAATVLLYEALRQRRAKP
jgi:23S rRNA (guanosine2251-2'-O)-methyltransferase